RSLGDLAREADRLRQERQQRNEQAQADRAAWRTQQEQAHARELAVNNLHHGRDALCERLREDYQIELAEVYELEVASGEWRVASGEERQEQSAEQDNVSSSPPIRHLPLPIRLDPAAANQEIAELRQKLSRLGSVNLDAIQEQTD